MRSRESLIDGGASIVISLFSGIAVFVLGAALGHGRQWWPKALVTSAAAILVLLAAAWLSDRMQRHAARCGRNDTGHRTRTEAVGSRMRRFVTIQLAVLLIVILLPLLPLHAGRIS